MDVQDRWVSEKEDWKSLEEYHLFLKQKKAYQFANSYCKDKYVLDYGCGSGYGTSFLSDQASEIVGVDISGEVIDFCINTYKKPNLSFQRISSDDPLPFEKKTFDVIVSFQVIEHIPAIPRYLFELERVLKDNGILLITTPNRKHRILPFQKPWNPDHIREYSFRQLKKELLSVFREVKIMGLYGNEGINEIEYKRVRQNPLKVYLYYPGKKILKRILPPFAVSVLKYFKGESSPSNKNDTTIPALTLETIKSKFRLEDFVVGERVDICLDFFAICQKR